MVNLTDPGLILSLWKKNKAMKSIYLGLALILLIFVQACKNKPMKPSVEEEVVYKGIDIEQRMAKYHEVELNTDLSILTEKEKAMLPYLLEAAQIMDELFWLQAFGDKDMLMKHIQDEKTRRFTEINYGPWDRLDNDFPFLEGFREKPAGANFYPPDMTKEEFEAFDDPAKTGLYNVIVRDKNQKLKVVPYHIQYSDQLKKASELLLKAATLAEDSGLKKYLQLRAKALLNDDYYESDIAWLDMKNNTIDFVVGPIENYEDGLFEYKTAYEAYVLVKDKVWSERLAYFNKFLPELQQSLPVMPAYKSEKPGTEGELNAYDVIYYAGDCNAGSKTIAINLPNDPKVQLEKGTRRLQLKNAMKAKFDHILVPISQLIIDPSQTSLVSFDAFFTNTMFHEVAHGLGIKYLVKNKKIEVKDALLEYYSASEEGKADILGLYMVDYLYNKGELKDIPLESYYVTFVASMFRSIRFGASSSHGKANLMRFNYFIQEKAIERNENGTYKVNIEKMKQAVAKLSREILVIQGDGNKAEAKKWFDERLRISDTLKEDLNRLSSAGIPTDLIFKQGKEVLGL